MCDGNPVITENDAFTLSNAETRKAYETAYSETRARDIQV